MEMKKLFSKHVPRKKGTIKLVFGKGKPLKRNGEHKSWKWIVIEKINNEDPIDYVYASESMAELAAINNVSEVLLTINNLRKYSVTYHKLR